MRETFQAGEPGPLLPFLFQKLPEVKRAKLRQWLRFGGIRVNDRVVTRHDHALAAGDAVRVESPSPPAAGPRLPKGMRILYEDEALLVIEKPANLLSIASKAEREATAYAKLTDYVRQTRRGRGERVWIVHRLDRETSGLMVFARTEAAKRALQREWKTAEKKYLAVTDGAPAEPAGTLRSHLDERDPFRVRSLPRAGEQTREAVTHYRLLNKRGGRALLELILETGRRHQIRVQLAGIRCPVVGDPKYHPSGVETERLALHASELSFRHPVSGEPLRFQSPLPAELERLVAG